LLKCRAGEEERDAGPALHSSSGVFEGLDVEGDGDLVADDEAAGLQW
jgi:hypothetical protein